MNEALIQNSQHDINHQDGDDQQNRQALERLLEFLHRALEIRADGRRHAQIPHASFTWVGRLAQRDSRAAG